jgi:aminoglycoside 6'-N-acetyltransferase
VPVATITFAPLRRADYGLLAGWLDEPLVARWWNHETTPDAIERDFGASIDGTDPTQVCVAILEGVPFGLIQRYALDDEPTFRADLEAVCAVAPGTLSMDYLIGNAAMRGRGLATAMISTFVADSWSGYPGAPAVLVPVIAGNERSWRALERAGFRRVAEGDLKPDNPLDPPAHVIYRIDRPLPLSGFGGPLSRLIDGPPKPGGGGR